jgi:predicted transcriptional regulator
MVDETKQSEQTPPTHKTFSIRIPVELFEGLEAAAKAAGTSRQSIVVSALTRDFERRRIAAEGAAKLVAEFDRTVTNEMVMDKTLQTAAEIQVPQKLAPTPAYDPAHPHVTLRPGSPIPPKAEAPTPDFPGLTVRNPPKQAGGKS